MADPATLVTLLSTTLQPDLAARKAAEEELGRAKVQPQCLATVLQILTQETVDLAVRQSAAIFFKNLVKGHWAPEDETQYTIPDATKMQVKDGLLQLFLFVPPKLQSQLSEAISLIASHDFPSAWPNLLGELVAQLSAAITAAPRDYARVAALLAVAHSITERYRHEFRSDTLYAEIKTVLQAMQEPLLQLASLTSQELQAVGATATKEQCAPVLLTLKLTCQLFYDLTYQDLPEYFEDHLADWIGVFITLLKYKNAAFDCDEDDTEPSPISCMQAEVVDCLALLMQKEEEAFQPHLAGSLTEVWTLLMATSLAPHEDLLVTTSIRFLTTVASSVHHQNFSSPDVLQNVCEKIIAPNVRLLDQDEELFDDNPFEYVRRDVEGSDTDTRRRVACDLVRALCRNYEAQLTSLLSTYVGALLGQAAASPANWKAKDAAVYLVIAMAVRGSTAKLGATQTNQLVNLMEFYTSAVLPELQAAASGANTASPVLLADALKFVTVFRNQLAAAEQHTAILPLLVGLLSHSKVVVHTYAATALDRLLTVRGPAPAGATAGPLRVGSAQLAPVLQPLLGGLFSALKMSGSAENAYVMRAILRVTVVAEDAMSQYASTCIEELKGHLTRVCENPTNPSFNHYIFEAIAALVRSLCKASPQAVDAFEAMLFPPFQYVLQKDVSEFTPYVFQILAQLLEVRSSLSPSYLSLFPPILAPTMWERPSNAPALVRLLCAYIVAGKDTVAPRLDGVLGVFQKLLASKLTDPLACKLLSAIWRGFEAPELAPFAGPIFSLCLTRLQSNKKVAPHMVACWSVYIARYGIAAFQAQLDAIQPSLLPMLVKGIWCDAVGGVIGPVARKCAGIATARLLTEGEALAADVETFGKTLQSLVLLILQDQEGGAAAGATVGGGAAGGADDDIGGDIDAPTEGGGGGPGYSAAYVGLGNSNEKEELDLYATEQLPTYTVRALQALRARSANFLPGIITPMVAAMPADKQAGAQALLQGVC